MSAKNRISAKKTMCRAMKISKQEQAIQKFTFYGTNSHFIGSIIVYQLEGLMHIRVKLRRVMSTINMATNYSKFSCTPLRNWYCSILVTCRGNLESEPTAIIPVFYNVCIFVWPKLSCHGTKHPTIEGVPCDILLFITVV